MSDSAIERLKERQRKKVPARKSSLTQQDNSKINSSDESINESETTKDSQLPNEINGNDSITEFSQLTTEQENNNNKIKSSQSLNEVSANSTKTILSQSLSESKDDDSLEYLQPEPIRRTIRLDQNIDEYLDDLCKEHKVTKETLFEAAISVCSKNQKTLNKVIVEAKDRYHQRKRIGEWKKLQTMNRKFQKPF